MPSPAHIRFASRFLVFRFLGCTMMVFSLISYGAGQVTVATYHNNKSRRGLNPQETTLTTANVNSTQFGKLFSQAVDGYIYAQPLYVPNVAVAGLGTHNVVYVATTNDSVYAFDADNNTGSNASPLWKTSFIDPANGIDAMPLADTDCTDIVAPTVGIVGTPVIYTETNTLYVIGRTKENGDFYQKLHALDITSGAEKFGGPTTISATVNGSGSGSSGGMISFDAQIQNQHSALLYQNGQVYIGWGSHCDKNEYHGWLMVYNHMTLTQNAVWMSTPNGSEGSIWQSGSGPAGDAAMNIYFATANGTFDVNLGGIDWGQTLIKLSPPDEGTLAVADYFTPYNGPELNDGDYDIGSGGVMLLPDQIGGPHEHLLVEGDKAGNVYLVDRDNMGHYNSQNNDQIVQSIPNAELGMWNSPAWFNNTVYFGAGNDTLKAFAFDPTTGLLATTPISTTSHKFGWPGTTPSISANDESNGILWALDNATWNNQKGAVLHAYDASNLAIQLYTSNQNATRDSPGGAVKFAVPTVANGKVYVGTQSQLSVYGLLAGAKAKRQAGGR